MQEVRLSVLLGILWGEMIEEMGLKGFAVGDAKVSMKHAGFLINDGHASCTDMMNLILKLSAGFLMGMVWNL